MVSEVLTENGTSTGSARILLHLRLSVLKSRW